ncbi:MAG: carboxypeptidase regulatory-like domain-containing protein [Bryobacteraceae bacterium]
MKQKLTLAFAALALSAGFAVAQTITGTITGTVVDPQGAVIPNAKVTATNTGTNVAFSGTTNAAGLYNLLFLPVGTYNVTVEGQGFKKSQVGPFALAVNQTARVDVRLELGDTTQLIEVSDVAPILQTESTQTGDSISSQKLTSLPLNGRNFVALTLLIPGAVSPNPSGMNGRLGARPYVNGNREQTNNFMLEGVDVNDSIDNRVGYSPNVDALQEVKVLTGNAAAEFGNAGGATVMLQLKSGTNQFRGNVFEFLRNNKLDSNGFFRNRNLSTAKRTGFKRNIFGGTLGGPIRKDKLFFFVDYEGTLQRTDGPTSASVAPQSWRNGDLSIFPNNIVDPANNGTPFPGKQIPVSRFSPVARFLFSNPNLYPLPNQPGVGPQLVSGNYAGATASKLNNHQGDVKVDYRLSDKDNLMARWSRGFYESVTSQAALPVFLTGGQEGPTQSAVLNWNRSVSSTIVNEARFAFSRVVIKDVTLDWSGLLGADGNQKFGIPGGQPIPGLSAINLGGGLSGIGGAANLSNTADNKYVYYDNLTWQNGKHLLKMGGQLMRYQQNRYYAGNNGALGVFRYTATYTNLDLSDFLLDQLNGKGRGAATGTWGHRFWRPALFVQDDFKVAQNFTLNLGLRWEYMQPIYEVKDRQVNIDTFAGTLITAGGAYGRALYNGYKKQFMPRIGFAWTPGGFHNKLVVRAGAAYQSFMEGTGANLRTTLNPPFFVETDLTYDTRTPGSITRGFADVVTSNITLDMARPAAAGITPQLQGRAWDLNLRPQTTSQINFTLEYQLDNSTSLSAGYVGQKGTHLVAPVEANQPLPGVGPFASWTNLNTRRPLYNKLPNLGNTARTESSATMDYHSLQVTGRRSLKHGLDFIAAYTLGKTLTDNLGYYGSGLTSGEGAYWQNAYDRRSNRGPSFFDIRQNFTIGGNWDLPYGKGQKWAGSNKVLDMIVGGWSTNYNLSMHSGLPLTVRAVDRTNQAVRGNVRANYYRPLVANTANRNIDNWFGLDRTNPSLFCAAGVIDSACAYGQPGDGLFGNSGIGTERGPSFFNLDFSIGKKFLVTERQFVDFRVELFNAFNHSSWAPPGLNIGTPATFGAIGAMVQNPRNIQFGLKYHF